VRLLHEEDAVADSARVAIALDASCDVCRTSVPRGRDPGGMEPRLVIRSWDGSDGQNPVQPLPDSVPLPRGQNG